MISSQRFLLLVTLVALLGCDGNVSPAAKNDSGGQSGLEVDSHDPEGTLVETPLGTPIRVTDDLKKEIVLPGVAKRIVSLSPRSTESLFAIGAGDQVVGVTTYCNYPQEAAERSKVGGFSAKSLSVETIVGLQPDLVVSAGEMHRSVTDQLESLGLTVLALQSESLSDLKNELARLGAVTGHEDAAKQLAETITQRIAGVEQQAARLPQEKRPTVFYLIGDSPLAGAGPDSYLGEMIRICGGANIITDPGARYLKLNPEVLIAADPDMIITSSNLKQVFTPEEIKSRPGWSNLKAIRNGQIHFLDGDMVSRCSPRVVEALEQMAAIIQSDSVANPSDSVQKTSEGRSDEEKTP
jgi:iron complex transport system substrate-binding protein